MNKILLSMMLCTITTHSLFAQKTFIQGTRIKENTLYLKLEKNELRSFVDRNNEAGSEPFDETKRFALQTKYCAVYARWINPLRYELKWSDSTFDNESDVAVKSYVTKLVEVFGAPVSNLNKDNSESKAEISRSGLAPAAGGLSYPTDGFHDLELTFLYLQLRQHTPALTSTEISDINLLYAAIKELDDQNAEDIASQADEQFVKLYNIKTAQQLGVDLPVVKDAIRQIETEVFKRIDKRIKEIPTLLTALTLSDKMMLGYYKAVVTRFVEQCQRNVTANRELIKKFDPIFTLMEASVEVVGNVPNTIPNTTTEYYKIRDVKIEEGKGLHTTVSLVEKEYDAKTHEFKSKSTNQKAIMQFRRYDPVTVFVSTGGFYSNTTLRGYGVDKDMKITEDDIQKGKFVSAAFLNFSFIPSRYISPLVQIGIDPTKKHPFLLLGGGFAIPVGRIAITAGGIWTWNATLQKLQTGQLVESTTDLEKDISYQFDLKPKGWYGGIQYNF